MRIGYRHFYYCIIIITLGCTSKKNTVFTKLTSEITGIDFVNTITEEQEDSKLISEFAYMGGGVGIGDFNNDGLKDIFFTANQNSCRLYLNKGNNRFEDITIKSGVTTNIWATGVSIADINNDGYDDIYICAYGKNLSERTPNILFINDGNLNFKNEAESYGLADTSYSTQASFFDYDKDGDLDLFLLNYRLNGPNANLISPRDTSGSSVANDRLYKNDGDPNAKGHPVFKDVSIEAGIKDDGYGLGVSIADYNGDNWPDIYVSNDFVSNDKLWLNNKNGTFTNCIRHALKHQSYSSMGSDAADINNDALPDITTLDMMPETNERKKLTFSFMNYERYETEQVYGYEKQFMRNMLQINNGIQMKNDTAMPFFSEVGQLAGMSETDWSWSVLLADFNNDGWKDIHITNGIGRDYINADFVQYRVSENDFSTAEYRRSVNRELKALKHVNLPNYFYLNGGRYLFKNSSTEAGIDETSLSGGAAYADLDNDGDLDLVVNNINKQAFIFRNNTIEKEKPVSSHYLGIILKGEGQNKHGLGTKVLAYKEGKVQMLEQAPVRGYLSSVDRTLLFGLGKESSVDSIVLIWPDDKKQTLKNIKADTFLTCYQKNAFDHFKPSGPPSENIFEPSVARNIKYKHEDFPYNDFTYQRLLPQKYSQLGPFLATGDVNKDGLSDFYVGGGFNSPGKLFIQQQDGSFQPSHLFPKEANIPEDADCLFFDSDNDGDEDLLVTCGDTRFSDTSMYYLPRLFINDGNGKLTWNKTAIPLNVKTIAGCIRVADYDSDGDLDLFIGGRVSKQYPTSPRSFLLQNNNGTFSDVTDKVCPALKYGGMITSAVWVDIDNNKTPDLVIAGEWMPIRFFKNENAQLKEITSTTHLTNNSGMWRSLMAFDMDKDGDLDLVAGNLGQNCKYHVTATEPMKLYAKDIDGNGRIDPIPFYYIKDKKGAKKLYPGINRDVVAEQVPVMKKKFLKHAEFAHAEFEDIFPKKSGILEFTCEETSSCYFENKGNGQFIKHKLPVEAQFSPINAIICEDFDKDGYNDLLVAGNEYQVDVMTGRYDASYGLLLKGSKQGFTAVNPAVSGFILNGDIKALALLKTADNKKIIVAAANADSLKTFEIK